MTNLLWAKVIVQLEVTRQQVASAARRPFARLLLTSHELAVAPAQVEATEEAGLDLLTAEADAGRFEDPPEVAPKRSRYLAGSSAPFRCSPD
jgi:hypothetical protein